MNYIKHVVTAATSLFTLFALTFAISGAFSGVSMASPSTATSADRNLVQKLAEIVLRCSTQTLHRNAQGHERLDAIQSSCSDMTVAGDRIVIRMDNTEFTLTVRDSDNSDGGDLVDLFLQSGSSEESEVAVATHLLAFGDPALATLQAAGLRARSLTD